MSVTFTWRGEEYKKKFKRGSHKALIRASNKVHGDAVLIVPVIKGTLKGSIKKKVDSTKLVAYVYTNLIYAPKVEFTNRHLAGHPFLRPSLMSNIDNIRSMFTEELRRELAN